MNPLISVIIPVYNVENFLYDCLKSVISQTYTNLEIILVDDGSTDKSGEICDEFSLRDSRIKVMHQKNAGQAVARNNALEICKGEFITFIDSDDIVNENLIAILYDLTQKFNTKIAMCGYKEFYQNAEIAKILEQNKNDKNGEVIDAKEIFKGCCVGDSYFMSGVCRFLFAKEIWANLRFPVGELHEDVAIFGEIFQDENVAITRDNLYFYRVRHSSSMHTLSEKYFSIFKNTEKFISSVLQKFPDLKEFCDYKRCLTILIVAEKLIEPQNHIFVQKGKNFHKIVKENLNIKFALKQGNFGKKLILYYIHPKLFEVVYKIYKKI
ncbi:glycosyltransferase [Campylobacter sp. JMF_06 NA1]|uniref:glycosyltransferase family 2 protein n=1 Tax=Campylobacter sp. JMF_06 NA1 TaxID=2983823 RepID=UPI0022EA00F0|nr:glycosyltransferase [Campylobacter sp. JMF_06 NA1]MDA3077459.1 glycosyltransferase [Campylobacter sp. JMF_06 NA1]